MRISVKIKSCYTDYFISFNLIVTYNCTCYLQKQDIYISTYPLEHPKAIQGGMSLLIGCKYEQINTLWLLHRALSQIVSMSKPL